MKYLFAIVIISLAVMLTGCSEPPPVDPCKEAKAKYPECETTGGTWVAYPMRAVDAAESCDCECGEGSEFVVGEGCVAIPPPPPCDGKTCDDGCTLNEETCECDCPQPPSEKVPSDYLMLSRVGTCDKNCNIATKLCHDVCVERCPWACWRDPEKVALECGGALVQNTFGISARQMEQFALEGQRFHAQASAFMLNRLDVPNKRCNPSHPKYSPDYLDDDGKCERSDVLKTVWKDFWSKDIDPETGKEFGSFARHKSFAYELRAMAQDDPEAAHCGSFDSIGGWADCVCN